VLSQAFGSRARAQTRQAHGADRERRGIGGQRPARPRRGDEPTRQRRPGDHPERHREAAQCVGLLVARRVVDDQWDEPDHGWAEERIGGPVDQEQHGELPDVCAVRQQQDRRRALGQQAHEIGCEHHELARQAVGPNTSDK
jgi:hypothetical protein